MVFRTFFTLLFLYASTSLFAIRAGYFEPWGKDASLKIEKSPTRSSINDLPPTRNPLIYGMDLLVQFHQNVISPVDGPRSSFRPTSSRYMLVAMKRHGFIKGYLMGCDRLIRENPDPWVYRQTDIDGVIYKWDPTYRTY